MDDWITTAEAARLSGYTADYVRKLAAAGRVQAKRWGRDWQISRAAVLAHAKAAGQQGKKRGPKPAD